MAKGVCDVAGSTSAVFPERCAVLGRILILARHAGALGDVGAISATKRMVCRLRRASGHTGALQGREPHLSRRLRL